MRTLTTKITLPVIFPSLFIPVTAQQSPVYSSDTKISLPGNSRHDYLSIDTVNQQLSDGIVGVHRIAVGNEGRVFMGACK